MEYVGKYTIWVLPKILVPQNGWFISWKTLLKWMIWGYIPLFLEAPIFEYINPMGLSLKLEGLSNRSDSSRCHATFGIGHIGTFQQLL